MERVRSFREYIKKLKDIGEVKEIQEEVDWDLEMGAWLVITIPKDWKERMSCSMDELMGKIGETVYSCKGGSFSKKTIVVNDDIDPTDTAEVIWAFATRNHPIRGIYHRPESRVVSLTAYLSSEEKKAGLSPNTFRNRLKIN